MKWFNALFFQFNFFYCLLMKDQCRDKMMLPVTQNYKPHFYKGFYQTVTERGGS